MADNAVSKKDIKCVIWDLDNTLWDGVLLEDETVTLKPHILEIIKNLDQRGILNSIASKNDSDLVMDKLHQFGLSEYFLYPQINWNAKSTSIEHIAKSLNLATDTFLFIDDQQYEREEVESLHPEVLCIDASEYETMLTYKRLNPQFITQDSANRRKMYQENIQRNIDEKEFVGPQEKFLASLNMKFIISEAKVEDLKRAEELTVRTNQLNATGKTYSYEELLGYMNSDKHNVLVCELCDKYGSYGKIGVALIEHTSDKLWHLRLLLMSCRVMSRGVGSVLLSYIMKQCKSHKVELLADFKETGRNKQMYIGYKFSGFEEVEKDEEGNITFKNNLEYIAAYPPYIEVIADEL